MVLIRNEVLFVIWFLHIHIHPRIAQEYLRSYLNVHHTSFLQIEFLRFQQRLSVTGYVVAIFLAFQGYIAEVLYSSGTDYSLKIPSFQYPFLRIKGSVFYIINRRITIDAIWLCHLSHLKQVFTTCLMQHVWCILSIQRVKSWRIFAVHLSLISVFHCSCQWWFAFRRHWRLLSLRSRFLSCTLSSALGITPLITSIADLDTVLYTGATGAAVRYRIESVVAIINLCLLCTGPPILSLKQNFNNFCSTIHHEQGPMCRRLRRITIEPYLTLNKTTCYLLDYSPSFTVYELMLTHVR